MKHEKIKKRLIGVAAALGVLVIAAVAVFAYLELSGKGADLAAKMGDGKERISMWYTDDGLTDYLNGKALEFYNNTNIRVDLNLVSGLEYLEAINAASLDEKAVTPDIYIATNDSLEKAYLAGLAAELPEAASVYNEGLFGAAARNAVSYKGKLVACPLYFETSALLYNKTYLEQIANDANEANSVGEIKSLDEERTQEPELITAEQLVPNSIAEILAFADKYSAPQNVEYFFRWDVSDIFYNYFFVGNYVSVGGEAGDDKSQVDIYNTESVSSLKVYQDMNQFFSIDMKETNYEKIMQEFQAGKTIYTIATSDCIKRLDEAAANGDFVYEYGVAKLPDIDSGLKTRGMSVTSALVINGYSENKDEAVRFMEYLVNDTGADLYKKTGKLTAVSQKEYADAHIVTFMENYKISVPIPKMLETGNFWVELEACFAKVWDGEDANTQIRQLSEQIKMQIAGEPVAEKPIEDPQVELLPAIEYEEGTGETDAEPETEN